MHAEGRGVERHERRLTRLHGRQHTGVAVSATRRSDNAVAYLELTDSGFDRAVTLRESFEILLRFVAVSRPG
jgi:hypothetical protein